MPLTLNLFLVAIYLFVLTLWYSCQSQFYYTFSHLAFLPSGVYINVKLDVVLIAAMRTSNYWLENRYNMHPQILVDSAAHLALVLPTESYWHHKELPDFTVFAMECICE